MDEIVSRDVVFETPYFSVVGKRVAADPAGDPFYSLALGDYVTVVGVTAAGELIVEGNGTRNGCQILTPAIDARPGGQVTVELDLVVEEGAVRTGVLNGTQGTWLIPPERYVADLPVSGSVPRGIGPIRRRCTRIASCRPCSARTWMHRAETLAEADRWP